MHDARTGVGQAAAEQQPVAAAGEGILGDGIGEGETQHGIEPVEFRPWIAAGLGETIIGEAAPRAGDNRHHCLEHQSSGFILVHPVIKHVAKHAAGLGNAEPDRPRDAALAIGRERIGRAALPSQESGDVTDRGQAHAGHLGIARRVGHFVQRIRDQAGRAPDLDHHVVDEAELELGWVLAQIVGAGTHRQLRAGPVRDRIAQRRGIMAQTPQGR